MSMGVSDFTSHTRLGSAGPAVSRLGLAGGYGVPASSVEEAFHEYGINYFYWVSRKPGMRDALRELVKTRREELVIAVQSYDHMGFLLDWSVSKALRELNTDYLDVLFLGWFNRMPGDGLLDRARRMMEEGKVRMLGVTGHNRRFHGELARDGGGPFDVLQVRYSAAHRGAEEEVFEGLGEVRPGIAVYTATRWGKLLKAKHVPPGENPLTASDCYRFVLSHPAVDVCMAGPRTHEEMVQGFEALKRGPLDPEEMERVRRIGDRVHG